jgi:hypothetical protein
MPQYQELGAIGNIVFLPTGNIKNNFNKNRKICKNTIIAKDIKLLPFLYLLLDSKGANLVT